MCGRCLGRVRGLRVYVRPSLVARPGWIGRPTPRRYPLWWWAACSPGAWPGRAPVARTWRFEQRPFTIFGLTCLESWTTHLSKSPGVPHPILAAPWPCAQLPVVHETFCTRHIIWRSFASCNHWASPRFAMRAGRTLRLASLHACTAVPLVRSARGAVSVVLGVFVARWAMRLQCLVMRAMLDLVEVVRGDRIPCQVIGSVVELVSVAVTGVEARWT